ITLLVGAIEIGPDLGWSLGIGGRDLLEIGRPLPWRQLADQCLAHGGRISGRALADKGPNLQLALPDDAVDQHDVAVAEHGDVDGIMRCCGILVQHRAYGFEKSQALFLLLAKLEQAIAELVTARAMRKIAMLDQRCEQAMGGAAAQPRLLDEIAQPVLS